MSNSSARETTLSKIRNALKVKTPSPYPVPVAGPYIGDVSEADLTDRFKIEFTGLLGKFVACANLEEAATGLSNIARQENWTSIHYKSIPADPFAQLNDLPFINSTDIHSAQAAITGCECLVARTGTIVLSSAQPYGRVIPVYTPVHIVIAFTSQLVADIKGAVYYLETKYGEKLPSAISFASGPSRTGDIEKTLVVGVHGPREVYLFLIND